jgi:hypothetical protein
MLRWLKRLFSARGARPDLAGRITPDQVDDPDELHRRCVAECFNTGRAVIGTVDDRGNFRIRPIGPPC